MADEQPDSLEGWVPVREGLFAESGRHQLRFLVAWNGAERRFAVTCHDRAARRRRGGAGAACSWAGLLSAQALRGAHQQLTALWPPLGRCFPELPAELGAGGGGWGLPLGLWARAGPDDAALQAACVALERYLGQAADGCGGTAVRDALFPAPGEPDDCEDPREFRERALRARKDEAGARLRQVLQRHEQTSTMVALMKLCREEEDAYQALITAATAFFQNLLQPFRDMREVATSCKLAILKSLEEEELGPRRVGALQKEAQEWSQRAHEAVASIQDITVDYFTETVNALAGMLKQMERDKKRFGQAAWATAMPRLENLQLRLAQETLQLLRAKELCSHRRRAEIRGKMEGLPEQEENKDVVDELELKYYEAQLELYEVKFEILKYEEMLLITQLDSIRRYMKDKQEEVIYYDPCESPEELRVLDGAAGLQDEGHSGELKALSHRCRQLESRRGSICARRAQLRNRKDQCIENHRVRLQQATESTRRLHQHHGAQMKRDKIKEEEKRRKEWIDQERRKTLQRLRAFKERHTRPLTPKTPPPASPSRDPEVPSSELRGSLETVPAPAPVPFSDQTEFIPSDKVSLPRDSPPPPAPPPPPPPPPLPPPPPAPPCPPLAAGSLSLHFQALGNNDRPRPLVCESPAQPLAVPRAGSGGPGSMDTVLASLRQDRAPRAAVGEDILAAIRRGVRLRRVAPERAPSLGAPGASDLESSIRAALRRIKKASADSEEDEEQATGEWER
ncbi:WASP homolog-associated protein with actin, membranes and microtubules [Sorex fumeus]|uniref:WASP homolog-associated protein with actin, membranes and microtubules n=1 Tax=Sorex fumeus TaxID=62283 RepID=UPI0024AD3591|nr:WASP homolog-associated protein with actin, membranes and microtubules [Sorex fumeus]